MKESIVNAGAVISAGLASICCLGPLALAGAGLGSLGLAIGLAKYRPLFLVVFSESGDAPVEELLEAVKEAGPYTAEVKR
ncbi:MAG: hypothetical protein L0191_14615 [Acidobacteria bacterium]|nr:hypothetical protein [Acidobacteriota bacterium]